MIRLLSIPVFAFLDRWGGGGFQFLGIKKGLLSRGMKPARRYGMPGLLYLLNPTLEQLVLCVAMSVILSFNLDEIEQKNWEEIFLYGFGLAAILWPLTGISALIVPAWWLIGIGLSNVGIGKWKLGWHWVELGRGFAIGLSLFI